MSVIASYPYQEAMDTRIRNYNPNPYIQKILTDCVTKVASERLRDLTASISEMEIERDFSSAVREFEVIEYHVFHRPGPPSLNVNSLKDENLPLSQNQSVIRHSIRSSGELTLLAKAFNITGTIREIIPFPIERLVIHNLTRRFILNFAIKNRLDKDLLSVIKPLAMRIFKEHLNLSPFLRDELHYQALLYLERRDPRALDPNLRELTEKLLTQVSSSGGELAQEEIFEAVAMRAADIFIENLVKESVDSYPIVSAPELEGYTQIAPQTIETRRFFMINGGVASGKSSALKAQLEQAKKEGVDWDHVCVIDRDLLKPLLLKRAEVDDEYKIFFPSFSGEETHVIIQAIFKEYQERLISDTAPHLYVDQLSPTIEMMRIMADPAGRGLDLTVVNTPVEASLYMAYGREQETGNHAVTSSLLASHASAPTVLIEDLKKAKKEGKVNIRLRIVSNNAPGILDSVAKVDFAKGLGSIEDLEELKSFFCKIHINGKAERFQDLYDVNLESAKASMDIPSMLEELI